MKKPSGVIANSPPPSIAAVSPVSFSIFRLAKELRTLAANLLRTIGLYPGQEIVIMHLFDHDGLYQSEIINLIGFDPSTATKMLKRLEHEGFIARRPAQNDRRAIKIFLTAKGKRLKPQLIDIWKEIENSIGNVLTKNQKAAAINICKSIERTLRETNTQID